MSLAFDLPEVLEAGAPAEARGLARDEVSLLVTDARRNTHTVHPFNRLADFLDEGDLLVVNDSATLPAALDASFMQTPFALHLSTKISSNLWLVEPRTARRFQPGDGIVLADDAFALLLAPFGKQHSRLWYAQLCLPNDLPAYLSKHGRPITYRYVTARWPLSAYQTIFAAKPGSVEMPSAARPFSLRTLNLLRARHIDVATITLHCGVASPERHEAPVMEWMNVSTQTVTALRAARSRNGRVVAVGTTAVRALETAVDDEGEPVAFRGWTEHLVDKAHPPQVASALLTGFHEPQATHLSMLEAFAPAAILRDSYKSALSLKLMWHEFGDVHLLL